MIARSLKSRVSVAFIFFIFTVNCLKAQQPVSVFFAFNKYEIDSFSRQRLDGLVKYLAKYKNYTLKISGYCDSVGGNAYNDRLSEKRASSAKRYLVSRGIPSNKIIETKGFGKRKPVNNNKTEEDRLANRRVDIVYVVKNGDIVKNQPRQDLVKTLDTAKEGTNIILHDINFYGGLHIVLPQAKPTLDTLVMILKKHPTLRIRIVGHVCCTSNGDDGEDFETHIPNLSITRAKTVYEYLTKHGIAASRLSYMGLGGKNHLVDPELTEDDRVRNRRVEIVIVKK
jgi:outer membrane protein OmpA-like peptidoglycan-associated protein